MSILSHRERRTFPWSKDSYISSSYRVVMMTHIIKSILHVRITWQGLKNLRTWRSLWTNAFTKGRAPPAMISVHPWAQRGLTTERKAEVRRVVATPTLGKSTIYHYPTLLQNFLWNMTCCQDFSFDTFADLSRFPENPVFSVRPFLSSVGSKLWISYVNFRAQIDQHKAQEDLT